MKVLVHEQTIGLDGLRIKEIDSQTIHDDEVRISIKYVGLNHRDLLNVEKHQDLNQPLYMGEDAAGIIREVGKNVSEFKVGDRVMVNPGINWDKNSDSAPQDYSLIGNLEKGSFAEEIIYPAKYVVKVPGYLSMKEAGAFTLSALTAYRALITKGEIQSGMKVLIPGIGGGVANFLLRFAKAKNAQVFVTSRSQDKLNKAKQAGADEQVLDEASWNHEFSSKVDLVIESVGAATFNRSLELLKPGGRMVIFGSSTGNHIDFNLRTFFVNQYTLKGSTMGSQEELEAMVKFSTQHKIRPLIDRVYDFDDYAKAFDRLDNANQTGKIVLKL